MIEFKPNDYISQLKSYPEPVVQILKFILTEGFNLCAVGGGVRDFLIEGKKVDDLDFEIRSQQEIDEVQWIDKLETLMSKISQKYKVEKLNYSVYRIYVDEVELELASPRLEIYPENQSSFGHSDFDIVLKSKPDYRDSFNRRDFTVNAIGIEIQLNGNNEFAVKLIDPFDGIVDIQNKLLRSISQDFNKDPVRFLRAVRFCNDLNFEISSELEKELATFQLDKISTYYLKTEALKSNPALFYQKLKKVIEKMNVSMNPDLKLLTSVADEFSKNSLTVEELLWDLVISSKYSKEEILSIAKIFTIKEKIAKEYVSFKSNYDFVASVDWSSFKIQLKDVNNLVPEDVEKLTNLHRYFGAYKQLSKFHYLFSKLDENKIHELKHLGDEINRVEKNKNFLEMRDQINNNLRSIFSLFYYFTSK